MTATIIALVAAIAAPLASIICVVLTNRQTRRTVREGQEELRRETEEQNRQAIQIALRTAIQGVYFAGKNERAISLAIYAGVCEMYDQYKQAGGNSYVHGLMQEMADWAKY